MDHRWVVLRQLMLCHCDMAHEMHGNQCNLALVFRLVELVIVILWLMNVVG